jgi:diaminohydroxyphosphoribosylaminopyrimidine deaminase/5-amino-6-(5-phosphoribosylamino)uracil reductase
VGLSGADEDLLDRALTLAALARRTASPNPNVGCVLVRDGVVLAEGWTSPPGGPHAEAVALAAAGDAVGATAYVTLEPCSHQGRTPPCADALVAAGVARVVVAARDPAPWVDGRGLERLRAAGVVVEVLAAAHPLAVRSRCENAGFRTSVLLGRPHVTYKTATSLDGRTATRTADSRWLSSPASRRLVHEWRAAAGAVLVGIDTAIADDATLTARDCDPPAELQPLRVVLDRTARLPLTASLVRTVAAGPVLVVTAPTAEPGRRAALEAAGVETVAADDLPGTLAVLHGRGVQSVLCEGGPTVAGALLRDGLIDRIVLFVAPLVIGDPQAPGIFGPGLAPAVVADALRLAALEPRTSGPDILLDAWIRIPA